MVDVNIMEVIVTQFYPKQKIKKTCISLLDAIIMEIKGCTRDQNIQDKTTDQQNQCHNH